MYKRFYRGLLSSGIVLLIISGCATTHTAHQSLGALPGPQGSGAVSKRTLSTVRRVITEKDVVKIEQEDPRLDFSRCVEILARLNCKDPAYIRSDIKRHRVLEVPKDFSSYVDWSPLPEDIPEVRGLGRFILVVKDIPYLGWYQNGRLVDSTYIGVGKKSGWTKTGFYRVDRKDPVHWSTYPDAYGDPAVMPDALHIYARVWIHLGDVVGPYCSHGCINMPEGYSGKLWDWATCGTPVLVTQSLKSFHRDLRAALQKKDIGKRKHAPGGNLRRKGGKSIHKKKVKV